MNRASLLPLRCLPEIDAPLSPDSAWLEWNHLANVRAQRYAVVIDEAGTCSWTKNEIDGAHLVAVVSRAASVDALADMASKGISYIIAGDRNVDVESAAETLRRSFGVERIVFDCP